MSLGRAILKQHRKANTDQAAMANTVTALSAAVVNLKDKQIEDREFLVDLQDKVALLIDELVNVVAAASK